MLVDRLAIIAPNIISDQQRGFIRGRNISDCICVASEAVNMLDNRSFGGNLSIKFDIRKAFDTLDWFFLIKVLKCFGFAENFCTWIGVILDSAKLSISINGHSSGYFSCSRGVRQGDPLSPLLFCLAEEVLRRGISSLVAAGKIVSMSSTTGYATPSHILYADDVLVFCKGTKKGLNSLMHLFHLYGETSGQWLNNAKCRFYAGSVSNRRMTELSRILGFQSGQLPFIYLDVPLFQGKPKKKNASAACC